MMFQIGGQSYEIDRDRIVKATNEVKPNPSDGRNKHYVHLHGSAYPIKQVVHLATGLPHIAFTAQHAHRILAALGFEVYQAPRATPGEPSIRRDAVRQSNDTITLPVVLENDEDGYVVASCPTLPGCHSQGRSKQEAISNIREAMRGYIASMRKHGEPLPKSSEVEQVEVPV